MPVSIAAGSVQVPFSDESRVVKAVCGALQKSWQKGLAPEPTLNPVKMAAKAMRQERAELEDGHWGEALRLLAGDLKGVARLNPLGRTIAHGLIVRTLRQRIRAARLWQLHPEISEQPIAPPIIILGQMRSGTTRLHRLLASDPRLAFTRLHETLQPMAVSSLRAILSASAVRSFLNCCNPLLNRIHPSTALAPEEEFGLHGFSIHGSMFEAQWNVPTFARWCENRDLQPVYVEFSKLVRTLRWRRHVPDQRIQLLKAPQFMQDLDAVLTEFPKARILWMQRDLSDVIASSASLVWNQQRVQSASTDRTQIGREWRRKTLMRQDRTTNRLNVYPSDAAHSIRYDDMNADWRKEVRNIYDFLGLPLTEGVLTKMASVANASAHVGHTYSAAQFGLNGTLG